MNGGNVPLRMEGIPLNLFLLSTYTKAGYIFNLPLYTFCFEMTVSKGAKIFAAVIAAIIFIILLVAIIDFLTKVVKVVIS